MERSLLEIALPDPESLGPTGKKLMALFTALSERLGSSGWWPAQTPFEVSVGAILTQNTAWRNVDLALDRLRSLNALTPAAMAALVPEQLEWAVQPSGFFRQKSVKLRNLLAFLHDNGALTGDEEADAALDGLRGRDTDSLRADLLAVRGIGPETADCILLYALDRPSFVVDAYTRRILHRHGMVEEDIAYAELRELFMDSLPEDTALFNEYHALLVRCGNTWCRKSRPLCGQCPLEPFLETSPV